MGQLIITAHGSRRILRARSIGYLMLALLFSTAVLNGAFGQIPSTETIESADDRARLPEFVVIPAITDAELPQALPAPVVPTENWIRSQGDSGARRFSGLAQINRNNVRKLKAAWTYHSGDCSENVQCTPIIVDGVVYGPTPGGSLVALDAETGREKWRFKFPFAGSGVAPEQSPARRGLVYWAGDHRSAPRLLVGAQNFFYAINPADGSLLEEFGERGRVPIQTGATVSAAIHGDVFVASGLYGQIYAWNVRTGQPRWTFQTIPQGSEFGADTWQGPGPHSGAHGWGGLSMDEHRGIVFVALGAARPDMVGIHRTGDNLFSNCILALDATTGKRLWHFQDVRHDIWDLDVCAPPNLVTVERRGRKIDAVVGVSKAGHLLLLERTTGKPLYPFRLRRAPTSTVPGERTSPYQPDPELPEKITEAAFSPDEITDRNPEAQAAVKRIVDRARYGFFPPPTEGVPVLYRGTRGGAEWSGCSFDASSNRLYVTSNRWVSKITLIASDERERDPRYPASAGETIYTTYCQACHGPRREGAGVAPSLLALNKRMTEPQILEVLRMGRGLMPAFPMLSEGAKSDLLDYLLRRNQPPTQPAGAGESRYTFDGYHQLVDHEGYPGIKPPWGLLNCYDLNTGKILWRVPLGEHEELTRQGVPVTGSQNLGGATATAGGLVFVGGTIDEKLRAFDSATGEELWSSKLPFAGTAAPAVYAVQGKQYIIVTATGGGRVGGKKGDAYVAFTLGE